MSARDATWLSEKLDVHFVNRAGDDLTPDFLRLHLHLTHCFSIISQPLPHCLALLEPNVEAVIVCISAAGCLSRFPVFLRHTLT